MSTEPTPRRRPLVSDGADTPADVARQIQPHEPPHDPLAAALPDWDLVPATDFLRRR
jgi:hypothetical protein